MNKKIGITLLGLFMFLLFSGTAMSDKKQLTNIFTYLHAHAADSPSPAKCK